MPSKVAKSDPSEMFSLMPANPAEMTRYECPFCGRNLSVSTPYSMHDCHGPGHPVKMRFLCPAPGCAASYSNLLSVQDHWTLKHPAVHPVVHPACRLWIPQSTCGQFSKQRQAAGITPVPLYLPPPGWPTPEPPVGEQHRLHPAGLHLLADVARASGLGQV